jgi:subtilisin family serine protease
MKDRSSAFLYANRVRSLVEQRPDLAEADGWIHRPRELLVTPDAFDDVASALGRLKVPVQTKKERGGTERAGTLRINLGGGTPVSEVVDRLEDSLGSSGRVGPNHVFIATPWRMYGPGGEPRELKALSWSPVDSSDGEGVRVGIVDTGLLPEYSNQSWLTNVHADPDDIEIKDHDKDGHIDPVVGHGTFIAGVVRRWAPRATIHIDKALTTDGLCDEITLAAAIDQALDRDPHILNLSLGAYTRKDQPPVGLEAVWKRIQDQQPHCVVVSAAGNDHVNKHFWPAATKTVIGVGAVDKDKARADFSNYGHWVDVWADGVDIESAFADGSYVPTDDDRVRTFNGICQWSGTSFATPLVAATIAARMSRDGVSAPEAYKRVKADAEHQEGVGKVISPQEQATSAY